MTAEEYSTTQHQLMLCAQLFEGLDLSGFIEKANIAESAGPVFNPTLYQKGIKRLELIRRIAEKANQIKHLHGELRQVIGEEKP